LRRTPTQQLKAWRGDRDLTTVSRAEALAFVAYLNEHHQPGGVANRVRSLRALYGWLIKEEMATSNPFAKLGIKVPDDPQLTATEAEIETMLERARKGRNTRRDVALLTLLLTTGCRKGEIAAVEVHDVDLANALVTFRESKSRPRTLPINDRTVVALSKWLRKRGTGPGSLWSVEDPYSLVRAVVRRRSKGELTPHALRRAAVVRSLQQGAMSTPSTLRFFGWSQKSVAPLGTYGRAAEDATMLIEARRALNRG
jgi:integrase